MSGSYPTVYEGEKIMYARLEAQIGGKSRYVLYTESNRPVPAGLVSDPEQYSKPFKNL
jgi:hypothetical protein